MRIGFLGTGEITRAIVTGWCSGGGYVPPVVLSPRGAATAAELAGRFQQVTVARSNAEVVTAADTVVLAVRPQDATRVLAGLPFRRDQAVVSLLAGVPLAEVARLVAPAVEVCRAVPLPEVARRCGSTPVHPATARARALFDPLGEVLECSSEPALDAHSAVTAVVAAHLDHLDAVSGWLADRGVAPVAARRYVAAMFREVAAGLDGTEGFAAVADRHATPGGINEQVRAAVREAGVHELVQGQLAAVFDRVSHR